MKYKYEFIENNPEKAYSPKKKHKKRRPSLSQRKGGPLLPKNRKVYLTKWTKSIWPETHVWMGTVSMGRLRFCELGQRTARNHVDGGHGRDEKITQIETFHRGSKVSSKRCPVVYDWRVPAKKTAGWT